MCKAPLVGFAQKVGIDCAIWLTLRTHQNFASLLLTSCLPSCTQPTANFGRRAVAALRRGKICWRVIRQRGERSNSLLHLRQVQSRQRASQRFYRHLKRSPREQVGSAAGIRLSPCRPLHHRCTQSSAKSSEAILFGVQLA